MSTLGGSVPTGSMAQGKTASACELQDVSTGWGQLCTLLAVATFPCPLMRLAVSVDCALV